MKSSRVNSIVVSESDILAVSGWGLELSAVVEELMWCVLVFEGCGFYVSKGCRRKLWRGRCGYIYIQLEKRSE